MRGIGLTHAFADISGLAFDRIFMITEPDGTFITARQFPAMVRFTPAVLHDGLHLTAPDGSTQSMTRRMRDRLSAEGALRILPAR